MAGRNPLIAPCNTPAVPPPSKATDEEIQEDRQPSGTIERGLRSTAPPGEKRGPLVFVSFGERFYLACRFKWDAGIKSREQGLDMIVQIACMAMASGVGYLIPEQKLSELLYQHLESMISGPYPKFGTDATYKNLDTRAIDAATISPQKMEDLVEDTDAGREMARMIKDALTFCVKQEGKEIPRESKDFLWKVIKNLVGWFIANFVEEISEIFHPIKPIDTN